MPRSNHQKAHELCIAASAEIPSEYFRSGRGCKGSFWCPMKRLPAAVAAPGSSDYAVLPGIAPDQARLRSHTV